VSRSYLSTAKKEVVMIFVRTYRCNSCGDTSSREGNAGDATLWTDCDHCKGPAHWCYSIPCRLCAMELRQQKGLMGELLDVEEQK
jgi:hypothetical protein